jgi:hypothetical protein
MEEQDNSVNNVQDTTFYTDLVAKATELKSSTDWQYGAMEFENIRLKWGEGPEADAEEKKQLYAVVNQAQAEFNEARKAHYEKLNERRAANLERREDLIRKMADLVEKKKWSLFNEVTALQRKFEDMRPLPSDTGTQNDRFQALVDTFNEHKVEFLVRSREKEEENLMGKLAILDKIKGITATISASTTDWTAIDNQVEDLSGQWRKVGRVVKERSDEIWDQFKNVREAYFAAKLEFNAAYREELVRNVKVREQICEKAEALLTEADLALASKEMNILHKRWKDTGPVSKDVSDVLWDRFKKAYDAFNEIRNANLDVIRDSEQKNLELKEAIITKAREIATSDEVINQKNVVEELYQQWNEIGPVPKRKTNKAWKQFKTAIDDIQNKRRSHFKEIRVEQKDNLRSKREIIEKIEVLSAAEDKEAVVAEVKQLQSEFQALGFVPIKQKNKVWDDYRKVCDAFYKGLRSSGGSGGAVGSANAAGSGKSSSQSRPPRREAVSSPVSEQKQKQNDIFRLRKECEKLNEVMMQYADTMTYIKPNKQGMVLRQDIQTKIDNAQAEIDAKMAQVEVIRKEIEESES